MYTITNDSCRVSRSIGVLLGACVGDALGAPFEGENCVTIRGAAPRGPRDMFDARTLPDAVASAAVAGISLGPSRVGEWTDDSEGTLALCRSLCEARGANSRHAALTHAAWWAAPKPPDGGHVGGYSAATFAKLSQILQSRDWVDPGPHAQVPQSYANGGAMRISPCGVAYSSLEGDPEAMRRVVSEALRFTHTHPEGVDSAAVVALAVARCVACADPGTLNPVDFVQRLAADSATAEMKSRLQRAALKLQSEPLPVVPPTNSAEEQDMYSSGDKEFLQQNCWTPETWFQIRGVDAVVTAVYMFAKYGGLGVSSPADRSRCAENCLVRVVSLGGDTDTIACITGSMLGSLHGPQWIPQRWTAALSQDPTWGVPAVMSLGERLAALNCVALVPDEQLQEQFTALREQLSHLPQPVRHKFV